MIWIWHIDVVLLQKREILYSRQAKRKDFELEGNYRFIEKLGGIDFDAQGLEYNIMLCDTSSVTTPPGECRCPQNTMALLPSLMVGYKRLAALSA